jgi:dynein heavy chain 2
LTNQVPARWSKDWEGPELPTNWVKEFAKRLIGMRHWVEATKQGSLLKEDLDLSELYHPEIMLNALKQKTAR